MMKATNAGLAGRLREYSLLMRVDRPIGIMLLLWPTLWGLWIAAGGLPEPLLLFVFVAGVAVMRSAGCVINDYADREYDPHVERTRNRPVAAGRVSPTEALWLFGVLCLIAFALVLLTNRLTVILSIPGVLLAASYPFMKRFTHFPQFHLGAAFGWAVPMAFAAQTGQVPGVAWLLLVTTVFWAVAYDTMYAMVDRDDDLKVGVKSTAILFGAWDRALVGVFQALVLAALVLAGEMVGLGIVYHLSLLAAAALFVYQQYLIRDRDRALCFKAFLNNNQLGALVFAGIALDYAL